MKRSGTSRIFAIGCIGVLFASYGIGRGIRAVRFQGAEIEPKAVVEPESPAAETRPMAMPGPRMAGPERGALQGQRGMSEEERAAMRDRFENMSEAEREDFRATMRDRFAGGGRRGGGGEMLQNLSEEEMTQFREKMDDLRARWEEMSEEEQEQARAQMEEKYGFVPRIGMGGGPGGGRGFGSGEFGGKRPGGGEFDRRRPGDREGGGRRPGGN